MAIVLVNLNKSYLKKSFLLLSAIFSQAFASSDSLNVLSDHMGGGMDSIIIVIKDDSVRLARQYHIVFPSLSEFHPDSIFSGTEAEKKKRDQTVQSGINATGSISRGLQISSNASLSLQSNMYLKISGKLGERYDVSGVLTEKQSPLQPIGNTRRLNDFDRVYIDINGPDLNSRIGDIDLVHSNGTLAQLRRSIEGIRVEGRLWNMETELAGGFSYGRYKRENLIGKDGKQGPYRLSGADGEKYIILLAGSEEVLLDDKLLIRGENNDYIIDYNSAEIHFTNKHIISSKSRISVSFEYVPDIYLASYSFGKQVIAAGVKVKGSKSLPLTFGISWQQLKDDAYNPLGTMDSDILENHFASLSADRGTLWVSTIYDDQENGTYNLNEDSVLTYVGEGLGSYSADFSFVGLEYGQYRKEFDGSTEYFVLDTISGEYLPAEYLHAPENHELIAVTTQYETENYGARIEYGLSQKVNNLYAQKQDPSNTHGWNTRLFTKVWKLRASVSEKYYGSGFQGHEALESLEYYRKWRLSPRLDEAERLRTGQLVLGDTNLVFIEGAYSRMERESQKSGEQLNMNGIIKYRNLMKLGWENAITVLSDGVWQEHHTRTELMINRTKLFFNGEFEEGVESAFHQENTHVSGGAGLLFDMSKNLTIKVSADQRFDYDQTKIEGSILESGQITAWNEHRKDFIMSLSFTDYFNTSGKLSVKQRYLSTTDEGEREFLLAEVKSQGSYFDNMLTIRNNWDINEEHIPNYDYHYFEVDTGYGQFSYDPNIKDFIPVQGGRYIRQRTFSDKEEHVRTVQGQSRLDYRSKKSRGKSGKRDIQLRLAGEYREKTQVDQNLALQKQIMLRSDNSFRTDYSYWTGVQHKSQLSYNMTRLYNQGADSSRGLHHELECQFQFSDHSESSFFLQYDSRRRGLVYNTLAEESWKGYRTGIKHNIKGDKGRQLYSRLVYSRVQDDIHSATYNEYQIEMKHRWHIGRRGRLDQTAAIGEITTSSEAVSYSMFQGRQPGMNWKYSLSGRYVFSTTFQMTLNYSIQQRGSGDMEQFLRMEGRTHF